MLARAGNNRFLYTRLLVICRDMSKIVLRIHSDLMSFSRSQPLPLRSWHTFRSWHNTNNNKTIIQYKQTQNKTKQDKTRPKPKPNPKPCTTFTIFTSGGAASPKRWQRTSTTRCSLHRAVSTNTPTAIKFSYRTLCKSIGQRFNRFSVLPE
jgi:hypothetical protein